jgi:hypothetical protein
MGLGGQPRVDKDGDRRLRQGRKAHQLHCRASDERRRLGRQRRIEPPGRKHERERQALEPARDEREGPDREDHATAGRRPRPLDD